MASPFSLVLVLLLAASTGLVVSAHTQLTNPFDTEAPGVTRPHGATQVRRILVLHWYGIENPSTAAFDRDVQATLRQSPGEFIYHAEYLEAGRFPGPEQAQILRDFLIRKYRDRKIDVILAWGAPPLEFLFEHRKDLFPGTPIVYYSSSTDSVKNLIHEPITGVLNPAFFGTTMELALSLHPDATEAFVITGTASKDKLLEREASDQFVKLGERVKFTYLTDLTLEEILLTVKSLPRHSVVFYARTAQEVGNPGMEPGDVLQAISRASTAPVYCPYRSLLGYGSIGGVVDDPVVGARKAAAIAARVARGARPEDVPIDFTPRVPMFDARQLARWGISESRLPSGSVILFREPTIWNEYRYYVIGTLALVAFQALLIGRLLVQRTRRRSAEAALRESEQARLRQMSEQKRELEVTVAERTQEVAALVAVSQSVTSASDLRTLLAQILDDVERVLPHTGAVVLLREADAFVTGALHEGGQTRDDLLGRRFPISALAPFHQAVVTGRPFAIPDVAADPTLSGAITDTIGLPPPDRGMMGAALVARGEAFGVLAIWHAPAADVEPEDVSKLQTFANQVAIAIDNARLYARSQRVAVLEERAHLARELHDSVTQSLHSIGLYARAADRAISMGMADVGTNHLQEVQSLAQEAMHEMRALIYELRPAVLEAHGLGPALRARIDSVEARSDVTVSLDTSGASAERRLPLETELELYRMAQEILNNVIKHAHAKHVWVTLTYGDQHHADTLLLEIRDDGVGFDLEAVRERATTGLRSLAERASKIGATLSITSAPQQGTTVRIELNADGA
jgi:signal transduction histidine kinase